MEETQKILLTLQSYIGRSFYGFGTFSATTDQGQFVNVDLHIDGSIEPFSEWANDETTDIETMHQRCEALVGKVVEVDSLLASYYMASNGRVL